MLSSSRGVAFTKPITAVLNTRNVRRKNRQAALQQILQTRNQRRMTGILPTAAAKANQGRQRVKEVHPLETFFFVSRVQGFGFAGVQGRETLSLL